MVNRKDGGKVHSGQDAVQDVGVPGVSGSEPSSGPAADKVRMLDSETYSAHYRHLLARRARDPDSRACCGTPPEGLLLEVAEVVAEPDVVQSSGVDDGETSPLPPNSWWNPR